MITPDMIPEKVTTELREAWNGCDCDVCFAVAFAAALNAWPGAAHEQDQIGGNWYRFILPLPQEDNG